jgi:hypothetical protein
MRTLIEILAGLAILANAVIYGTDVFGAIVLRPAIAAVDDRTLTHLLGHVHPIADRRSVAMAALAAASGHWVSTAADALATLALIIFLAIYTPGQQAGEHSADRSGTRRPSAGRRSSTPGPLGLSH